MVSIELSLAKIKEFCEQKNYWKALVWTVQLLEELTYALEAKRNGN